MRIEDLGQMPYRPAWEAQEAAHAQVVAGTEERLLLVEHAPVITLGRRTGIERNLLASPEELARRGVELVQSDRGGDITFHGLGQVVAYPIIRLLDHKLSVGAYVRRLEDVVIAVLAEFGIAGQLDPSAIGVWADDERELRKICAFGVRIKRGVSMHGLALNVNTDLRYFDLINPCGLGRGVTSMRRLLGEDCPSFNEVKHSIAHAFVRSSSFSLSPLRQAKA